MSVFGVVVGVVVGTLIGIALSYAVPDSFIDGITIPWSMLIIVVILAVLAAVVAALYPAYKASTHERARSDRHGVTRRHAPATRGPRCPRSSGSSEGTLLATVHAPDGFGDTLGALPPEAERLTRVRRCSTSSSPSTPSASALQREWPTLTDAGGAERHGLDRLAEEGQQGRDRHHRGRVARTAAADRLGRQQGVRDRRHVERAPVRAAHASCADSISSRRGLRQGRSLEDSAPPPDAGPSRRDVADVAPSGRRSRRTWQPGHQYSIRP